MTIKNSKDQNQPSFSKQFAAELTESDLAQIFNYPAIGELFSESDPKKFEEFNNRLASIMNDLERIIRYGNRAEADSAMRATKAIQTTSDFLQSLQNLRSKEK